MRKLVDFKRNKPLKRKKRRLESFKKRGVDRIASNSVRNVL